MKVQNKNYIKNNYKGLGLNELKGFDGSVKMTIEFKIFKIKYIHNQECFEMYFIA